MGTTNDLIKKMKERIKNSGSSKKDVLYFAADAKKRIRFLQEFEEGKEYKFHSSYAKGIQALCQEQLGKDCPYCGDTEIAEVAQYAWSVFDYDANAVRILCTKANGISPIPSLIEFYENYGTVMDRDYVIKKIGKGQGSTMTVMPGDKTKFRNEKAKAYSEKKLLALLSAAYTVNAEDLNDADEIEEEETTTKKSKGKKKEKTLQEKYSELTMPELKEIALSLGYEKSEIKGLDAEELVDSMFEEYEEDALQEMFDDLGEDDE